MKKTLRFFLLFFAVLSCIKVNLFTASSMEFDCSSPSGISSDTPHHISENDSLRSSASSISSSSSFSESSSLSSASDLSPTQKSLVMKLAESFRRARLRSDLSHCRKEAYDLIALGKDISEKVNIFLNILIELGENLPSKDSLEYGIISGMNDRRMPELRLVHYPSCKIFTLKH